MTPTNSPSAQPRMLCPIHSAALMEGPAGVALHLQGADGAMTQVPLTLAALREIAALAGAAAATHAKGPPSP
jgi:hypothetical protein